MPLTEDDVRRALSDPILQKLDFWVDNVHIRAEAYNEIEDLIYREQILVVAGTNPNLGHYQPRTDTITPRNAAPDVIGRSSMIHECTHALIDMDHATVTANTNEAAARIVQATYVLLSSPTASIPSPFDSFLAQAVALVQKFKLDTAPGAGTKLRF